MSGTVEIVAPYQGAQRITASFAFIITILKQGFRIAAIVAAIFFLTIVVSAVVTDVASVTTHSGAPLFGCD